MNTETLTTPSPELKKHLNDLGRDANQVVRDVKKQANDGLQEIKSEATNRFENAKGTAQDVFNTAKDFVAAHPFSAFGAGVAAGLLISSCRRK